jgi:hypothetical protein
MTRDDGGDGGDDDNYTTRDFDNHKQRVTRRNFTGALRPLELPFKSQPHTQARTRQWLAEKSS